MLETLTPPGYIRSVWPRAHLITSMLERAGAHSRLKGPASNLRRAHTCYHGLRAPAVYRGGSWQSQCGLMASASPVRQSCRQQRCRHVCRATIDDPELADLMEQMESMRPAPPTRREKLEKAISMIDEANSKDPTKVEWQEQRYPYRLLYSHWLTEWVEKLDPKAPDELLILARGRNMESWTLNQIKRDDYSPNSAGYREWERDKRKAQTEKVTNVMKAAGYGEASIKIVEDVMLDRNVPDPRDIRRHDLVAPLGLINYRLLEEAVMIQTLRDADALVFMEKTFPQMSVRMPAAEVLPLAQRELASISGKCAAIIFKMNWTPVQRKLLAKAMPGLRRLDNILSELEGAAAASTHPGDWRYRNFDYD